MDTIQEYCNKLETIGYSVIQKYFGDIDVDIKFRHSKNGVKKRLGVCHTEGAKQVDGVFVSATYRKIIVNLRKVEFIEDPNGKYHDKTGKKFSKGTGIWVPREELMHTFAHELAHIRYYKHDVKHKCFTEELYNLIKKRYEDYGTTITGESVEREGIISN